ncbi:MAG TPA: SMC family ATPase [Patescibacteria group bacterium]|jgi:exonuclease SbcC|nr:SMC family ATPase [Patescibacteria group bacterium]
MIPHSLFIRNFLSYGDAGEHISFDPYHFICLSGKNGHGKSALLDALTWAIWGHARKTLQSVKPDQGLLRLGQSHMIVIAEFSCNGQRYRIRREYMQLHHKPYAQLEFGLLEDTKLIPLTDKTIKATQAAIINTIKLDYEAFCNTVFLRQGASNEFSKKSAKERKELLATILGLGTYEKVRKLALHKVKDAQIEQTHTHNMLQRLSAQLVNEDEIIQQYTQKQQELMLTVEKIDQHLLMSKKLEEEKQKFYKIQEQLQQLIKNYEDTLKHEQTIVLELRTKYKQWSVNKKKLTSLPLISTLLSKKNDLLYIINSQQKVQAETLAVQELLLKVSQQKDAYHQATLREQFIQEQEYARIIQNTEQSIKENNFHQQAIKKTLAQQQEELQKITTLIGTQEKNDSTITELQNIISTLEKKIDVKKIGYQKLVAHGNMLATKKKELSVKIQTTYNIQNPSCPMCEQNLSLARKKFLRSKFEKELILYTHQLDRISKIIPTLKDRIISQHETINTLKKEEAKYTDKKKQAKDLLHEKLLLEIHITDTQDALRRYTEEFENLTQDLLQKKIDQHNILSSFTEDKTYTALVSQVETLTQQLAKQPYNQDTYIEAMKELESLHNLLTIAENGTHLLDQCKELKKNIPEHIARLRVMRTESVAQLKKIEKKKQAINALSAIHQEIENWQIEYNNLTRDKEELIRITTGLLHQIEQCTNIRKEQNILQKTMTKCRNTIEDYTAIATATGKDGIQALLIEEAIPAIEYEANRLLAKLTQNNARIFIDSLKDLKNGTTKETLDIKIADNAGIRPYELFSGGEAFRIDFALRIAVSTLLAKQAGTSLQTLIIDEGFGSQDEEGLHHITNTLHKIQDSFAKIIIVSHLPNMKDQFPIHFVIDKTTRGSTIKVIELG